MNKVQLLLAIHCHQPVGNFGHVFAEAHDRCYRPFIDLLAEHPQVRLSLHLTGPLLEWLDAERPQLLGDVRALVARGQLEMLGGGFYEPMLAVLPDWDAQGQIERMKELCGARLGQIPTGMWLAERVWDPDLPRVIAPTGTRYTLLDDQHFFAAGLPEQRLIGYYVTEKAGAPLAIFPIDKGLRYRIPFKPVQEVIDYLKEAAGEGGRGLCYGDDGEKFGLWPGTHEWVFEKGWLSSFFTALEENRDAIETLHLSEYLGRYPASGRVYLPTASYEEMMEWAMPAEAIRRYERFKLQMEKDAAAPTYRQFVHGGIWQAFLAKYPEANNIHKRMLHVSRKLLEAEMEKGMGAGLLAEARTELFRGQCNCAYWHGLFGGLYLNYLRHALYHSLIRAENLVDQELRGEGDFIEYEEDDFDCDLRDEALMSNARLCAYVDPDEGGGLFELDYRPKGFNLADVLARRDEAYHDKLRALDAQQGQASPGGEGPKTIHDLIKAKEPDLAKHLIHDGYRRLSFLDRFHAPDFTLDALRAGGDGDIGSFAAGPYAVEASGVDEEGDLSASITLAREGEVRRDGRTMGLRIEKTFRMPIDAARLEVAYVLENRTAEGYELIFAPELNLTLLAGDSPERYLELPSGRRARLGLREDLGRLAELRLVDTWSRMKVAIAVDREAGVWIYPVETVSLSEGGFERTYQGSCLLLRIPLALQAGERTRIAITVAVDEHTPGPEDRA